MKTVKQGWVPLPSGMFVPAGSVTDLNTQSKTTYAAIRQQGERLEGLYAANDVAIPPASDLDRQIQNSKSLSEEWLVGDISDKSGNTLFQALHLARIADAVLPLSGVPGIDNYLRLLCAGSLDFLKRLQSPAKDHLWELETWVKLKQFGASIDLCEPDSAIRLPDSNIGIACKKVYSERNFEKVLSGAVKQLEEFGPYGVVALNVDDLVPTGLILKVLTVDQGREAIERLNMQFIQRHLRHFVKYLKKGRLTSVVVSTSMILETPKLYPRFSNIWQWHVWDYPYLPLPQKIQLQKLYRLIAP